MGLLPTQKQPQDAPAEEAPAPEEVDTESTVSPEEQEEYDTFVGKASEIIYGEGQVMPEVVEALKPAADPAGEGGNPAVMALANAAVQVVQKLDVASKEAGSPVSDDVLYHGAVEVIEMLAEVAETAGFHEYTEEELNGALFQAVDIYRPIAEEMGRTSADTLKGQFAEVVEADQAGKLGDLLPGMGEQTMGEEPVKAATE